MRFECLALVDCKGIKLTNCLCSSSHDLQDRDPDASCESQGIALQVHITIDRYYLVIIISEIVWKRTGRSWFKIRADSKQLLTVSPLFFYHVLCLLLLFICLTCLPSHYIHSPLFFAFCLPAVLFGCQSSTPFRGWSFVLIWFQVIPGADDKFNSTRKQSAGAQFRVWYCCPEVLCEMKAVIKLPLHCFQSAKHG